MIDAIWSVGTRYAITTGVINRYIAQRRLTGGDATGDDLTDLLTLYDHLGGIDAFIDHIGTRNRVSTQPDATLKGAAVQQAATALLGLGINTAAQFRASDATDLEDQARTAWTAVPGQSSGVSWRYLRMLLGLPDVKPDRMVIRFIASALGIAERTLERERAVQLVCAAAERLGVEPPALDHAIWTWQTTGHHAHDGISQAEHLKALAHAVIGAAFPILAQQHVIPASVFQPFVHVGRDYAGPDIMHRPEFQELESALEQAYPGRFAEPLKRRHAEFANHYVFRFLEAAIARCALGDGVFEADSPAVTTSADELLEILNSDEYALHCCRAVTHITTAGEEPVQIGEVTVYPEAGSRDLIQRAQQLIPAIPAAFGGDLPFIYAPPHALLVSTARVLQGDDPYTARRGHPQRSTGSCCLPGCSTQVRINPAGRSPAPPPSWSGSARSRGRSARRGRTPALSAPSSSAPTTRWPSPRSTTSSRLRSSNATAWRQHPSTRPCTGTTGPTKKATISNA